MCIRDSLCPPSLYSPLPFLPPSFLDPSFPSSSLPSFLCPPSLYSPLPFLAPSFLHPSFPPSFLCFFFPSFLLVCDIQRAIFVRQLAMFLNGDKMKKLFKLRLHLFKKKLKWFIKKKEITRVVFIYIRFEIFL